MRSSYYLYAHLPEGEPQISHAAGMRMKNGHVYTGIHWREGLDIWWEVRDENGYEYATIDEPVVIIDLTHVQFVSGTPEQILAVAKS